MRCRFVLAALWASTVVACASGDLTTAGEVIVVPDGSVTDGAQAPQEAGPASSPDTGPTSHSDSGGPGVYDGGPPAKVGGDDAATDGPVNAGFDAFDAIVCGPPIPSSSYGATCSSCTTTGNILSCTCKNDSQSPVATTLDMCTCTQPPLVANTNGVLTCP